MGDARLITLISYPDRVGPKHGSGITSYVTSRSIEVAGNTPSKKA
jgi:hypothetical protein